MFPYLIPTQLQENENYWVNVFEKWNKPFLVAFGSEEKITMRMKDDFMMHLVVAGGLILLFFVILKIFVISF